MERTSEYDRKSDAKGKLYAGATWQLWVQMTIVPIVLAIILGLVVELLGSFGIEPFAAMAREYHPW